MPFTSSMELTRFVKRPRIAPMPHQSLMLWIVPWVEGVDFSAWSHDGVIDSAPSEPVASQCELMPEAWRKLRAAGAT